MCLFEEKIMSQVKQSVVSARRLKWRSGSRDWSQAAGALDTNHSRLRSEETPVTLGLNNIGQLVPGRIELSEGRGKEWPSGFRKCRNVRSRHVIIQGESTSRGSRIVSSSHLNLYMSFESFKDHGRTAFVTVSEELQSRWNGKVAQNLARETGMADHLCILIHG